MDRKMARGLSGVSVVIGLISACGGGGALLFLLITFVGTYGHGPVAAPLFVLAVAAVGLGLAINLDRRCDAVLDPEFVAHEGAVASAGRTEDGKGVVTFADGYVCELDFNLAVEPGTCLAVWRDGRDDLKRIEVKRPQP